MDFIEFSWVPRNSNMIEVVPDFVVGGVDDLILKKGKFIAFYDDETGYWSNNQNLLIKRLDAALTKEYNAVLKDERYSLKNDRVRNKFRLANSNYYKKLQDYFKLVNDCNADIDIDSTIKFANSVIKKTDYSTGPLDYALEEGSTEYWDHLLSVLYAPTEQTKIEWLIGSIISGDSKEIQKFFVFYGNHGTGKSTIFNIIQAMFPKYWSKFDAERVTSSSEFALDTLRDNKPIAIQHDSKLDRIIDNSKLNSIVSHESLPMNTKGKDPYLFVPKSMLIIGTNSPVKITDEMSGLKRRLIVVEPTGNTLPPKEYDAVLEQILNYERGAIAYKCLSTYKKLGKKYFKNYDPISMSRLTNALYNFLYDTYIDLKNEEYITLSILRKRYKEYIEENNIRNPIEGPQLREQIKNFFKEYHREYITPTGQRLQDVYIGLRLDKFDEEENTFKEYIESDDHSDENVYGWLSFNMNVESGIKSNLDLLLSDCMAQGAAIMEDGRDRPKYKWQNCKTLLKDIDTSQLHYVKPIIGEEVNLVVVDFDKKDANGNKDFNLNLEAASKWPPTYAELSKSGAGIHLHYLYSGDINMVDTSSKDDVEIKIFTGDAALRRKLSRFNNLPIAAINSGLPLKEIKEGGNMYNDEIIITEKSIRKNIIQCLLKKHHGHTTPEMHFIKKILDDAYESGVTYNVSDMYNDILQFAMNSSNQAEICLGLLEQLKLKSKDLEDLKVDDIPDEETMKKFNKDEREIAVYDIEIYPNLFIFGYKPLGKDKVILVNPRYYEVEEVVKKYRLVGFYCLHYDNIITYAAMQGYNLDQLYQLSHKITSLPKGEYFKDFNSEAVKNICYTDIFDYSKKKQSLKKWEIELGINHQEMEWDWNTPIPEELWPTVIEYNGNDLDATEAVWYATATDFKTRQILADISGGTVNMTDNQLTAKLIFGNEKNPQDAFYYRNLAEPVMHLDPDQKEFLEEIFPEMMAQRHGEAQSYLPYFPGYKYDPLAKKDEKSTYKGEKVGEGGLVRAEPGVRGHAKTFDVTSMHPHSLAAEYYFGKFTRAYYSLVAARKAIKHKRFDVLEKMFNGALIPYLKDKSEMKKLSTALKVPINAVYGLTAAGFANKCKDPRNIDNIVAKRGALFMMDLRDAVRAKGYKVFHIKTDSLKVENPDDEIQQFIFDFGLRYGYSFEVEHEFEKICLVNDAVYIAKLSETDPEWLEDCEKAKAEGKPEPTRWTATGAQFQEPYVFKSLFSHEEIAFDDLCEIKNVSKGALYLDFNEGLPDVTEYELVRDIRKDMSTGIDGKYTKRELALLERYVEVSPERLDEMISTGHKMTFIGKVGKFCPVKPGCGGGDLLCLNEQGNYVSPSGCKGWKWMEADYVIQNHLEDCVDMNYFEELNAAAIKAIVDSTKPDPKKGYEGYGDYHGFIEGLELL